jgi:hypothetical protein
MRNNEDVIWQWRKYAPSQEAEEALNRSRDEDTEASASNVGGNTYVDALSEGRGIQTRVDDHEGGDGNVKLLTHRLDGVVASNGVDIRSSAATLRRRRGGRRNAEVRLGCNNEKAP